MGDGGKELNCKIKNKTPPELYSMNRKQNEPNDAKTKGYLFRGERNRREE